MRVSAHPPAAVVTLIVAHDTVTGADVITHTTHEAVAVVCWLQRFADVYLMHIRDKRASTRSALPGAMLGT